MKLIMITYLQGCINPAYLYNCVSAIFMNDIVRRWPSVEKIYLFIYFKSLSNPAPWPITQPRPFWRLPRPFHTITQINLKDPYAPDSCFIIPPKRFDTSHKPISQACWVPELRP